MSTNPTSTLPMTPVPAEPGPMRISIVAPQVGALGSAEHLFRVGRLAEDLGFDGIWVLDRLLAPLAPREPYPASADGTLPAQFRRVIDP